MQQLTKKGKLKKPLALYFPPIEVWSSNVAKRNVIRQEPINWMDDWLLNQINHVSWLIFVSACFPQVNGALIEESQSPPKEGTNGVRKPKKSVTTV